MVNNSIKQSSYLDGLKKEIKELEKKYSDIMLDKKELEQKLYVFKLEYDAVISPYYLKKLSIDAEITRILNERNKKIDDIRRETWSEYSPDDVTKDDVKKQEKYFDEQGKEKKKLEKNEEKLSIEDKWFLKKLYKKLVMMFHPDRFAWQEEKQQAANEIMKQINAAYTEQDFEKLKEIEKKWFNVDFENDLDEPMLSAKKEQLLDDINTLNISIDLLKSTWMYKLYEKYIAMWYDLFYWDVIMWIKEDIEKAEQILKYLEQSDEKG